MIPPDAVGVSACMKCPDRSQSVDSLPSGMSGVPMINRHWAYFRGMPRGDAGDRSPLGGCCQRGYSDKAAEGRLTSAEGFPRTWKDHASAHEPFYSGIRA